MFPIVAWVNFFDTVMEYKFHRYIAPFLIGSISGFLVGLMKDRLMDINTNLDNMVREKTIELKMKIKELETSQAKNIQLIDELGNALKEVKQLSGLLPICSYCKKIRDDKGYWNQIESYIHRHEVFRDRKTL